MQVYGLAAPPGQDRYAPVGTVRVVAISAWFGRWMDRSVQVVRIDLDANRIRRLARTTHTCGYPKRGGQRGPLSARHPDQRPGLVELVRCTWSPALLGRRGRLDGRHRPEYDRSGR